MKSFSRDAQTLREISLGCTPFRPAMSHSKVQLVAERCELEKDETAAVVIGVGLVFERPVRLDVIFQHYSLVDQCNFGFTAMVCYQPANSRTTFLTLSAG